VARIDEREPIDEPNEVLEPKRPRVRRGQLVTSRALFGPRTTAAANRRAQAEADLGPHLGASLQMLGLATNRLTELYAHLRGLQLNDVLIVEAVLLDTNGVGTVDAKVSAAAIAVANYGSTTVAVVSGAPGASPPRAGVGTFQVGAGRFVVLPTVGTVFTVYGRAGETVEIALLASPVPPTAGDCAAPRYFAVTLPVGVSQVLYTTPTGLPATYCGFTVRETAGAAATFRIRDTNVAGKILETVQLSPNESAREWDAAGVLGSSDTLYFEFVVGAYEGTARVR
jgi:hypothetical protein